jgi:hypothetical protein
VVFAKEASGVSLIKLYATLAFFLPGAAAEERPVRYEDAGTTSATAPPPCLQHGMCLMAR